MSVGSDINGVEVLCRRLDQNYEDCGRHLESGIEELVTGEDDNYYHGIFGRGNKEENDSWTLDWEKCECFPSERPQSLGE